MQQNCSQNIDSNKFTKASFLDFGHFLEFCNSCVKEEENCYYVIPGLSKKITV